MAALPGGDPLAAALAAGETPSPEMVLAAGKVEGMARKYSVPCLVLVVLCHAGDDPDSPSAHRDGARLARSIAGRPGAPGAPDRGFTGLPEEAWR